MCNVLHILGGDIVQRGIGMIIKQISDRIRVGANEFHQTYGLTFSQAQVLYYLYASGGTATQKEVETYLEVSHPAVVGLVARLSEAGFVTCYLDKSDRRSKILCVTQQAREVEAQMLKDRVAIEEQMSEGLSPQELEELHRMLSIVARNVNKQKHI